MKLQIKLARETKVSAILTAVFYLVIILSCRMAAAGNWPLASYGLIVPAYSIFIGIFARIITDRTWNGPIINAIGYIFFASFVRLNANIPQGFGFVLFLAVVCFLFTLMVTGITTLFIKKDWDE